MLTLNLITCMKSSLRCLSISGIKPRRREGVFVSDNKAMFESGRGDMFFGLFRLTNQLGVDVE